MNVTLADQRNFVETAFIIEELIIRPESGFYRRHRIVIGLRRNMKILNPRVHGYVDYLLVAVFLLAPTLLGMSSTPSVISYALAAIHFTETILTAFPLGLVKLIPFTLHGASEFVVSIALVALPWVVGFASDTTARNFYVASGVLIFVVWLITDYKAAERPAMARA